MGMENLSPGEAQKLEELMHKVQGGHEQVGALPEQPETRAFGEAPKPNPSIVKRVLDPEDWVEKQLATLEAVGRDNYIKGIQNPKKDPIEAGIAAQKKYENAMKDPEVLARREAGLRKTNIDEWTAMSEALGADKLVEGVLLRKHKVERFVKAYQPLLLKHLAAIDAMPNATEAEREKKMIANKRGLQKIKGKARGG